MGITLVFLGHLAVGFAAKRAAPKASLGVLLGAAELSDLLFPAFLLAGWEQVQIEAAGNAFTRMSFYYPFSHSLAATLGWAAAAGGIYWLLTRYGTGAVVAGLLVLSHWVLDVISHKPDMPLYPGASPLIGLGLWRSLAGTAIVEGLMLAVGLWLYTSAARPLDRKGVFDLWSFVTLMVLLYAADILAPPPSDARAVGWVGASFIVFFFYTAWFDRHRKVEA